MARFSGGTGPTGPQGLQGLEGPMGQTGADGPMGVNGLDGLDGADGAPGLNGLGYSYNRPYIEQVNSNQPIDFSTLDNTTLIASYDYQPEAYATGDKVRVIVDANPDNWIEGYVHSVLQSEYNGSIGIAVERWNESSTYSSSNPTYKIHLIGEQGPAGAGYDVTVDTYASYIEIQKLLASDSENFSKFGNAVSISGDGKTMVVSAPTEDTSPNSDNGAVYVFTRSGTSWVEQAKLIASDANSLRLFGTSISISEDGNTIVVGTPRYDPFFNVSDGGVAYIFTRSGTTWTEQAKLIANDMTFSDYFGQSVSISGDGNTVIVGAYFKNANMFSQSTGAAYIFTRSGSTWTEQEKLVASDPEWYDYFGKAVAISADGSTAFIQAESEDTSPNNDNGAVYVFTNSGTSWTQQAKLLASDAASYESFGNSISASEEGNTVVIGSIYKTTTPNSSNGAVYVFTRSGSTWNEEAKLIASDTESYEAFGSSVSISADGDTIVVGAEAENTAPSYGNGAAYIFTRSSSTWTQQEKLLASNLDSSDTFGRSVSISADKSTVIVGSVFGEPNDTGSIYVFNLNLIWPAVFSIGAYLGNSYVKAISSPSTYAEGILNTSESESYSILVESASGSFALDAPNTVSLSIAGVPGITGANGTNGTNGIDGAGYDYVMAKNMGGPGVESEPLNTTINLSAPVGGRDFGAYAVGNYVRYYPNPEADPTAWVEGEITSRTTDSYEHLTILIDNWSPTAPGIYGANFDATIRPYMTLATNPSSGPRDIDWQVAGGTLGTQPTFNGDPLFSGSYVRTGSMVHFRIDVDFDNITSFGTGQHYLYLPFNPKYSYMFTGGCLHDFSTGITYIITGHVFAGNPQMRLESTDNSGNSSFNIPFTATAPITLQTADNFHIYGDYIAE